jgi:methionine synthase II (cobalamin-independent)
VYWHPVHSRPAYPTAGDYLHAMRDYIRGVVERVIARGCDYMQLDAPNYGMFHCDDEARAFFAAQGRDLAAERAFDLEINNSVFDLTMCKRGSIVFPPEANVALGPACRPTN